MEKHHRVEYLYQEYSDLHTRAEAIIKECMNDFKVLGASGGAVLLWKPIADFLEISKLNVNYRHTLFFGFLVLLSIISMILIWNLFKQFYIVYYITHLENYEKEIRAELCEKESSRIFSFNSRKRTSLFFESYMWIYIPFLIILIASVSIFPSAILWQALTPLHSLSYLLIATMVFGIYILLLRKSTEFYFQKRK